MPADLHVHSRASDGSLTIGELLAQARSKGVDCLGLTDHDYTAHVGLAADIGVELGVTVIPGVEISARDRERGGKVHILGYFLPPSSTAVEALCRPVLEQRNATSLLAIDALRGRGISIELCEVEDVAWGDLEPDDSVDRCPVIYRQHVAEALRRKGVIGVGQLMRSLYGPGGACHPGIDYPGAIDAVRAIKADGGLAVLAHPGLSDCWAMIPLLVSAGTYLCPADQEAYFAHRGSKA